MQKRISRTYFYAVIIFSLVVLGYSVYILYSTFQRSSQGTLDYYFGLFAGILGIALAVTSLMRIKGKIVLLEKTRIKTNTLIKCEKCDSKIIRKFEVGDYVHKEVGECQQCKSDKIYVRSIYSEKPEKKQ